MRKVCATLTVLILMTLLGGVAAAQGPEGQSWESILADAVPGPMEGVHFGVEKVASGLQVSPNYLNVYPYLAYTSAIGTEFYNPPVNDFTVGVGGLYLNDYFILLNHDTCGMTVIYLLINRSGGDHWYYVQEEPNWCGLQGEMWRFYGGWSAVPEMPGDWTFLPITRPTDGDGYPIGPNSAWPFVIHY